MDLYYPMPSEHTEPCFILCRANTQNNYFKNCKTVVCKNERLSFLVDPNPNPNPNHNPNQTLTLSITLTLTLTLTLTNNIFHITIFLG